MTAAMLVLEPIFEADLEESSSTIFSRLAIFWVFLDIGSNREF